MHQCGADVSFPSANHVRMPIFSKLLRPRCGNAQKCSEQRGRGGDSDGDAGRGKRRSLRQHQLPYVRTLRAQAKRMAISPVRWVTVYEMSENFRGIAPPTSQWIRFGHGLAIPGRDLCSVEKTVNLAYTTEVLAETSYWRTLGSPSAGWKRRMPLACMKWA